MQINICGGQHFKEYLSQKKLFQIASCNEAMSKGKVFDFPFSQSFISSRVNELKTTTSQYHELVIRELNRFITLTNDYVFYFDDCDLCQCNILMLLCYCDLNNYHKDIKINYYDKEYNFLKEIIINPKGYKDIYRSVFLKKEFSTTGNEIFDKGIITYLSNQ